MDNVSPKPVSAQSNYERRFGTLRSAVSPGTVIHGKLSFDTPIKIEGKLNGELFSSRAVVVESAGEFEGNAQIETLIVLGKVTGHISAQKVELSTGASLTGELECKSLKMAEGASLNADCVIEETNS